MDQHRCRYYGVLCDWLLFQLVLEKVLSQLHCAVLESKPFVLFDKRVEVDWLRVFDVDVAEFVSGHFIDQVRELEQIQILEFPTDHFSS